MRIEPTESAPKATDAAAGDGLRAMLLEVLNPGNPLQLALEALPIGIFWASLKDRSILSMNRRFKEEFGYQPGDFDDADDWIAKAYPFAEDRQFAAERWGSGLDAPGEKTSPIACPIEPMEIRVRCKDGAVKTVIHSGVILPETGCFLATFVDITQRKLEEAAFQEAARKARENESIYRLLLDHSPGMIILTPFDNSDKSRRYVSPAVEHLTGFTAQEYLSMKHPGMIHPDDRAGEQHVVDGIHAGNLSHILRYRALQKRGGYRWVEATISGYLDPDSQLPSGYIATVRDISQQKIREETLAFENRELVQVASLDELTGIANRRTFNKTLEIETQRHTRSSAHLSLLLLDVDYFKQYNDLYGHLPGDACLRAIAATLKQSLRRVADLAARFGGEEFVALLPLTDVAGAEIMARHIVETVAALKIPHAGSPHGVVTVSIGVSSWPPGLPLRQVELIECADRALYQAKSRGRNRYHMLDTHQNPAQPGAWT